MWITFGVEHPGVERDESRAYELAGEPFGWGGLPGRRRHCRGPTPTLGLPGTKGTVLASTMQSSFRTTLRSPLPACSITTVRSGTARTQTGSPATVASKPPPTSWLRGGTMVARGTSCAVLVIKALLQMAPSLRGLGLEAGSARRLCVSLPASENRPPMLQRPPHGPS